MLTIRAEDPGSLDATALMDELSSALAAITGDSGRSSFEPADVRVPGALFLVARDTQGHALGCVALRPLTCAVAELKRMYARPGNPGTGGALLARAEQEAAALGYAAIWLETRVVNSRAVRFYREHGYGPIANYGKYAGRAEALCMAKPVGLTAAA